MRRPVINLRECACALPQPPLDRHHLEPHQPRTVQIQLIRRQFAPAGRDRLIEDQLVVLRP